MKLHPIRALAIAALAAASSLARAEDPPARLELHAPTMGGKQFWADELFFHQWRIQRNVLTGHCRLLDGKNLRHASGTFPQCREKLEQIRRQREIPPMQGKAVIVLHGLLRSRSSMDALCKYLAEKGGYSVFNVGYPTTRRQIGAHARVLSRVVDNLDGIEEINFVGHSMGNIVIRHYLGDQLDEKTGRGLDRRIKRFVMLAPPNQGSLVAQAFAENRPLELITGEAVRQLGADWEKLRDKLATPPLQFGIIAGGTGNDHGFNPLLPGDDDGIVTLAHARLAGAHDFVVVPSLHSLIILNAKAKQYALRFLQKGYFVSASQRNPIRATSH